MTRKPFKPRPYQQLIIDHILETPRCAVWAGMGMGKTSATLTAVEGLLLADDAPTLVIAPLRVAEQTWPEEVRKWSQLGDIRTQPILGTPKQRIDACRTRADVYTTNYENLPWLVEYYGESWPFRNIVADESTKLKSFRLRQGGKRAAALAKIAHTKVERFVQLTGTPCPSGLEALWGQMWFLDRGKRLGRTFQAFKDRWFRPNFNGFGSQPLPHAQAEIQGLLKDLCITIEAKDWLDIREPIVNNIHLNLPAPARRVYEDLEREMFATLDSGHELEAFNAAARTIKCLQLANGACYVGEGNKDWSDIHDQKIQALDEIIEEANGMPVLVAYHFKSDLARLMKAFPGGIDLASKDGLARAKRGEGTVWFGHPASMGHGVDGLQYHSNQLVFFGHWWNLEERLQMIERIGPTRQLQAGMDRPMWIHNLIMRDTVDEMVIERVNSKREIQDILLEAMKRKKHAH